MTPIPEITNAQLRIVTHAVSSMETFFALVPDAAKDTPAEYAAFTSTNEEIDNLVHLGILEIVPKKSNVLAETLETTYGREVRILKVTNVGKAMFNASKAESVN